MSGSMNRNPSSQPSDNNKDGRKDVFNLTVGGQKVSTQQSFSTFTPQDKPDFTEVLSKRNVRKQQKQQQQQILRQHIMTTRSSSTGPQVVIEQQNYDKSAYQQVASSVSSRRPQGGSQFQTTLPNESGNDQQDETSMDIDNNKNDNQQSTRQSSKDKQTSNPSPEDLDDQQNGKLSFRARAPFNKILGNNRIAKLKFLKNQLYKDYDIVKITTIYQKKDKENLFQIEFDNQDQYDKFTYGLILLVSLKYSESDEKQLDGKRHINVYNPSWRSEEPKMLIQMMENLIMAEDMEVSAEMDEIEVIEDSEPMGMEESEPTGMEESEPMGVEELEPIGMEESPEAEDETE
ncbi:hypothetical protein RhiirA4_430621 [Rhizophagus irregularis]|uniref:Uncharacterized protein n=1 Tax=Rhizophagus irregularis TaxID=588596 RepID=A0A2I1HLF3_9GLOM|nr:hypothetical protein RhiirA4_430621 [Rhizophagus irregularis]